MSTRSFLLPDSLYDYTVEHWLQEPEVLRVLREETAPMEQANMQISPEQGQFMQVLVRAIGAKRCLEIGVFTGYSSTAVALVLPPDGRIVACDVSEEFTAVARRSWERAGVAEKVELILGPAADSMKRLGDGSFW